MSFRLTTSAVLDRSKDVTRRVGWDWLRPGVDLQPIVKGQGLKKGERVERLGGPIRVIAVHQEPLRAVLDEPAYGLREVRREGFPDMTPQAFVEMFTGTHGGRDGCTLSTLVTRIEFVYLEVGA